MHLYSSVSRLTEHSKSFTTQVSIHRFAHTFMHDSTMWRATCSPGAITIHTRSHTDGRVAGSDLGFSILPKDTLTWRLQRPPIRIMSCDQISAQFYCQTAENGFFKKLKYNPKSQTCQFTQDLYRYIVTWQLCLVKYGRQFAVGIYSLQIVDKAAARWLH